MFVLLTYVDVVKGREGDDDENGPNDTSGIVWAHYKFFFFFFHI